MQSDKVKLGEALVFQFVIENKSDKPQPIILDYAIHFMKANGTLAPKVFKLKTGTLKPHDVLKIKKTHMIKPITTRTFYPGSHKIEILANGKSLGSLPFILEI